MNNPEYILEDELAIIVAATRVQLAIDYPGQFANLAYKACDVYELESTLIADAQNIATDEIRYPLVWFEKPYKVKRNIGGLYGRLTNGRIFIINRSNEDYKSAERLTINFKPIILPIYRELLRQMDLSVVFATTSVQDIPHSVAGFDYWGENNKSILTQIVDCLEISELSPLINNNDNNTVCLAEAEMLVN